MTATAIQRRRFNPIRLKRPPTDKDGNRLYCVFSQTFQFGRLIPEDERGHVPEGDSDASDPDKPDEWRDVCDDPTDDPHAGDD